jgi:hypothetical protein
MEFTVKRFQSSSSKELESHQVTTVWGNDGWCYIPALRMRQKYKENKYFHEKWDGVIAMPEYTENITWRLYSRSPLVWRETGNGFDYVYETKK